MKNFEIPYQKLEVPESGSTLHIMVAECRMLQKDRVLVSKIWIRGYWFWSGLSCIATASNPCRIVHIKLLATVGWKWGCQPFSCRCSLNVTHCGKEISLTRLSKESIPAKFALFFLANTFNSWRDQRVGKSGLLSWESQFNSNARVDIWVVNQWWIRMILRRKSYVPEICCPRSIQATHTHACHSEVSIRLFGSCWFVVSKAICCGIVASCKSRPQVSI